MRSSGRAQCIQLIAKHGSVINGWKDDIISTCGDFWRLIWCCSLCCEVVWYGVIYFHLWLLIKKYDQTLWFMKFFKHSLTILLGQVASTVASPLTIVSIANDFPSLCVCNPTYIRAQNTNATRIHEYHSNCLKQVRTSVENNLPTNTFNTEPCNYSSPAWTTINAVFYRLATQWTWMTCQLFKQLMFVALCYPLTLWQIGIYMFYNE